MKANEIELIKNLHEQLFLWLQNSRKKDKHQVYEVTGRTLRQAETLLAENNIAVIPGRGAVTYAAILS